MLEVAMWIQCCAACNGYSAKPGYSTTSSASAAGNGDCNGIVVEYNDLSSSENRVENGFRPRARSSGDFRLDLRGCKGNDPPALLGPKAQGFACLVGSEGTGQF